MKLTKRDMKRMTKGFTFAPDTRTKEEKIATLRNTLETLRARPQNRATDGLIKLHENMLQELLSGSEN
ncbi:hypothetical protein [Sorangium sp. So ce131]|uniref:hypothetical protein n=1 Tax=Sorangium sp. So ce131 TaxID=3133282 RepID=UPI003F5F4F99